MRTRPALPFNVVAAWLAAGVAGWLVLPWYALPDAFVWSTGLATLWSAQDTAPAIVQATRSGRIWLWGPLLGLVAVALSMGIRDRRQQALLLTWGAALGVAALLIAGFTIGIKGWSIGILKTTLPPLATGQYGIGYGGIGYLKAPGKKEIKYGIIPVTAKRVPVTLK